MRPFRSTIALSIVLLATGIFGCGEKLPQGMPPLQPVSITITMDGQTLPEAAVSLVPVSGTGQWVIGGQTGDNGTVQVKTHGTYLGAPAGEYIVCVSKSRFEDGPTRQKPEPSDPVEKYKYLQAVAKERKEITVVDPNLKDPKKSTLKITVAEKGKTTETFEVPGAK